MIRIPGATASLSIVRRHARRYPYSMRPPGIIAAVFGAVLLAPALSAGEMVLFEDGRSIQIASHEPGADGTWLLHTEGGVMAVPVARVLAFRDLPHEPPPEPGPPANPADETVEARAARLARELDVEPGLVAAVISVESSGDPFAVSPKGAAGLMQLMPATARSLGVKDVFDPDQNLRAGITHLKGLLARYHGDYGLALAAYNAGQGAVSKHKGIPPYRETTDYVVKVLKRYLGK
jgi:hypothetical protein